MEYLTITGRRATDKILIPIRLFNPESGEGASLLAELDTGNDHTAFHDDVLHQLGVASFGPNLSVVGVTGASIGRRYKVTIGVEMDLGHRVSIEQEVVGLPGMSCPALLGRDMLRHFDVRIARSGFVTLSMNPEEHRRA